MEEAGEEEEAEQDVIMSIVRFSQQFKRIAELERELERTRADKEAFQKQLNEAHKVAMFQQSVAGGAVGPPAPSRTQGKCTSIVFFI